MRHIRFFLAIVFLMVPGLCGADAEFFHKKALEALAETVLVRLHRQALRLQQQAQQG
jgi:hypothetical protein